MSRPALIAMAMRKHAVFFGTAIFIACVISGCGGGGGGGASSITTNLPGMPVLSSEPDEVSNFSAREDDGIVSMTWEYKWTTQFKGILIRRGTDGYPDNPSAQDTESDNVVYNGELHSYTDKGLSHRTKYYYSIFVYDKYGNYSEPEHASATAFFDPYTFVVVPDTQYYSLDYPSLLNTMMDWVVESKEQKNIKFLFHEGDLTHKNTVDEWINASNSFDILEDGSLPYAFCIGNHDDDTGRNTTNMNEYLPVSRYVGTSTFGGVFEKGKMDNTFHLFSAGGLDWLVISLEYNPRDDALEWANGIVEEYPDRKVILLTHAYVYVDNDLASIGTNIWEKFSKYHSNLLLAFNGHYTAEEGARLVSTGDNGNKVYQMFANYQDLSLGGLGYMRIVTLDPDSLTVTVKTYSPYLNEYRDDDRNQFEFTGVNISPD